MQPYLQLNSHCIGKSHLAQSKPCEDYSLSYGDSWLSAAIISDGHGDSNCFRSAQGAKAACEICLNMLRQFQGVNSHITDIRACDFEPTVRSLEREIAARWKKKVLSDAAANPFSPGELQQASEEIRALYQSGQNVERAYGCTLIAAMVTRHYFLCLQIGDGKCVSAYPGGIFVEPVPGDENCIGNRSTSLCSRDAEKLFRHYYSDILPLAAFVSSDGVEESFDTSGLYHLFYSAACWGRQEGAESACAKMNGLLPKISEGGSGDDVSLSCFISAEGELAAPRQPLGQVYQRVNAFAGNLERIDDMILLETGKMQEKIKLIESVENELDALKKEVAEKEKSYCALCGECEEIKAGVRSLQQKRDAASEQMKKAEAYRQSAEDFWFAEYKRLGIAGIEGGESEFVRELAQTDPCAVPPEAPAKTVLDDGELSHDAG